ncbi:MAG: hypothetical protein AB7U85_06030 [Alphaproteobacteria bacterium]
MTILLFIISLFLCSPSLADDASPLKQAMQTIKELPLKIQTEREKIANLPLGPFEIRGSCEYDKVLFWNTKKQEWVTSVDFSEALSSILVQLDDFRIANDDIANRFKKYQNTLLKDLIALNDLFNKQKEVYANDKTPDKNVAKKALEETVMLLEDSIANIGNIMQTIGDLDKIQKQLNESLTKNRDFSLDNEKRVADHMEDFARHLPCGGGDVRSKYAKSRQTILDSLQKISGCVDNVSNNTNTTIHSAELLLGTMQSFLSRYSDIEKKLNQVSTLDQTNAVILEFYLLVTQNAWSDLAKDAQAVLQ